MGFFYFLRMITTHTCVSPLNKFQFICTRLVIYFMTWIVIVQGPLLELWVTFSPSRHTQASQCSACWNIICILALLCLHFHVEVHLTVKTHKFNQKPFFMHFKNDAGHYWFWSTLEFQHLPPRRLCCACCTTGTAGWSRCDEDHTARWRLKLTHEFKCYIKANMRVLEFLLNVSMQCHKRFTIMNLFLQLIVLNFFILWP